MFVKNYLTSVADTLQSKFEGMQYPGQNPADRGELAELFVKNFLSNHVGDQFKIFRGGKIIGLGHEIIYSKQIDIVLTAKNSLKIFDDKGLYPVETVYGAFSIASTLDKPKLSDCIEEFKSIPKSTPKLDCGIFDKNKVLKDWKDLLPYRCVFGFTGNMNYSWEEDLNRLADSDPSALSYLPDLIVVNKRGIITRLREGGQYADGMPIPNKRFHFTDFNLNPNYYACFSDILNRLFILSTWQYQITPRYADYFNKEL